MSTFRVPLDLTDGDTFKRITIPHPGIGGRPAVCCIEKQASADEDDQGWVYVANVVSVAQDTFEVNVAALVLGEVEINDEYPNETLSLVYTV